MAYTPEQQAAIEAIGTAIEACAALFPNDPDDDDITWPDGPAIVVDWYIIASLDYPAGPVTVASNSQPATQYFRMGPAQQPLHHTRGLLMHALAGMGST